MEVVIHKNFPHLLTEMGTLLGLNEDELGKPKYIRVNRKEATLPQTTGFLESAVSQLIAGE